MTTENGIYVLQGVMPADIAAAPVGVKVVEIYDDSGQLFSATQVAQMESGGGLLLGYFSIGEAENYRPYFSSLPTSILGPVDPSWPGDYQVAYWTVAWQTVATNYIDQMITQGYGGAFLDVVDECETSWAQQNAPGGDAEGAMVSLFQYLANYAHAKDPDFKIWVNSSGAEDLMTNSTFVNSIDGAYQEELFYKDNGSPQSAAETNYNLNLLDNLVAAGKPVVAVEYISAAAAVADIEAKAANAGIGYYIANPDLNLDGVDTEGFTACYAPGTRIATPGGETRVEDLQIGDGVVTAAGVAKPIKWIGRRSYDAETASACPNLRPVLIRKGALAENVPHRDLRVSPMHALFVDEVFVPAAALVNGVSILRSETGGEIHYLHVELENHEVIFAEGAPAESYVDDDSRAMFDNAAEYYDLYGIAAAGRRFCAPRLEEGYQLEAIRHHLALRAGTIAAAIVPGELAGHVERLEDGVLEGWVMDRANPAAPVELEVLLDGETVAAVLANRYRVDVDRAGFASARCGFSVAMPAAAASLAQVEVRRRADGSNLPIQQPALAGA